MRRGYELVFGLVMRFWGWLAGIVRGRFCPRREVLGKYGWGREHNSLAG